MSLCNPHITDYYSAIQRHLPSIPHCDGCTATRPSQAAQTSLSEINTYPHEQRVHFTIWVDTAPPPQSTAESVLITDTATTSCEVPPLTSTGTTHTLVCKHSLKQTGKEGLGKQFLQASNIPHLTMHSSPPPLHWIQLHTQHTHSTPTYPLQVTRAVAAGTSSLCQPKHTHTGHTGSHTQAVTSSRFSRHIAGMSHQ